MISEEKNSLGKLKRQFLNLNIPIVDVKHRMNATENWFNGLKDKRREQPHSTKPKIQINGNYEWQGLKTWIKYLEAMQTIGVSHGTKISREQSNKEVTE